jgi:hypothetical protein
MAERVVYPVHFSTPKIDEDGREYVDYTDVQSFEGPSRYGEFPGEFPVSGRCVGAEDPITLEPYDSARPGLVLQPERGPGHCFQDEPGETGVIQSIWNNGNPSTRKALSEENKSYLKSRIAPPYPWEPSPSPDRGVSRSLLAAFGSDSESDEDPPAFRMRLHFQDGSSDEIPCDENADIDPRNQSALENAVSIEISLGVTAIEMATFASCINLVEITLPEGVTRIGEGAFNECTSLAEITLPTTVTTIGVSAFSACDEFDTIVLPDGVRTIDHHAFCNCTSLAEINIPEGVTRIQDSVFYNCISLRSITLPTTVTSIGFQAFEGCTSLAEINIPEGVTEIKSMAFRNCTSLNSIIFPSSVATYGEHILAGCTSLRRVYLANDSGQQDVIGGTFGVVGRAVTIYRNFSFNHARLRDSFESDSDSDEDPPAPPDRGVSRSLLAAFGSDSESDEEEGPPTSRIRLGGALYDWTGGNP